MWPAPRHQRAPGLCVPAGEPGHVGVDCGAAATCSPVCGWWGPSCDVATSTSGQKEEVPVNMEGPSRDCAPQAHTPCRGTPALTEGAPASAGCAAEQRSRQQCAGVPGFSRSARRRHVPRVTARGGRTERCRAWACAVSASLVAGRRASWLCERSCRGRPRKVSAWTRFRPSRRWTWEGAAGRTTPAVRSRGAPRVPASGVGSSPVPRPGGCEVASRRGSGWHRSDGW